MSKAEMILYSPASYFLCIIVVQIIKEPIFLGISVKKIRKKLFSGLAFFKKMIIILGSA